MKNGFVNTAILGASGYTGAELVRLLLLHPFVKITALTADRHAGSSMADVFPHLSLYDLPVLQKIDDVDFGKIDLVFCALPHGTTQAVIAALPPHVKIIDLSADFRLRDLDSYQEWYGHTHAAPELQREAVYGLTEIYRAQVKNARLVANPGCYPTASSLPLIPLLANKLIEPDNIIIDAKSGVSGAGRAAKQNILYCEVAGGMQPYGVAAHRHAPEIEQILGDVTGTAPMVTFTPHLIPMDRGMLATTYVKMTDGVTADQLRGALQQTYDTEKFVHILPEGQVPSTRDVLGSNHCKIAIFADRTPGRAIILSVIDNLVKGASGQAIQNMNVMYNWLEETALKQAPLFP